MEQHVRAAAAAAADSHGNAYKPLLIMIRPEKPMFRCDTAAALLPSPSQPLVHTPLTHTWQAC